MLARRDFLSVAAAATALPAAATPAPLKPFASYDEQCTGVAATQDGRIFVCSPRWETDTAVSVAELKGGKLVPYPNAEWNAWRNIKPLTPKDHFICVQSVTVDAQGFLWIVDAAAPGLEFIIPDGPKLLKVDLKTNQVVQNIAFDTSVAPQGSYLNDVRVSPDGKWAYLTDSGAKGALLTVDLQAGKITRLLDGAPSTQPQPGVVVHADGHELRRPDGRGPSFAADGIALSTDGATLYWQEVTGRTLFSASTESLRADTPDVQVAGPSVVADGLWIARDGRFYITSPEDNSVKRRAADGKLQTVLQGSLLQWPDSMAEMADGSLLVTASDIQGMAAWHKKGATHTGPWHMFRFKPAG